MKQQTAQMRARGANKSELNASFRERLHNYSWHVPFQLQLNQTSVCAGRAAARLPLHVGTSAPPRRLSTLPFCRHLFRSARLFWLRRISERFQCEEHFNSFFSPAPPFLPLACKARARCLLFLRGALALKTQQLGSALVRGKGVGRDWGRGGGLC